MQAAWRLDMEAGWTIRVPQPYLTGIEHERGNGPDRRELDGILAAVPGSPVIKGRL